MEKHCRKCQTLFSPRAYQERTQDWMCQPCTQTYRRELRLRRLAAGIPAKPNSDRRKAMLARYYADPKVKQRRATLMRGYTKDLTKRVRYHARWMTRRAIVAGRLVRQPCEVCRAAKTDAHHPDYMKPLNVVWLCRPCHRIRHTPVVNTVGLKPLHIRKTHCLKGHPYSGANLRLNNKGWQVCRTCRSEENQKQYKRRKATAEAALKGAAK